MIASSFASILSSATSSRMTGLEPTTDPEFISLPLHRVRLAVYPDQLLACTASYVFFIGKFNSTKCTNNNTMWHIRVSMHIFTSAHICPLLHTLIIPTYSQSSGCACLRRNPQSSTFSSTLILSSGIDCFASK